MRLRLFALAILLLPACAATADDATMLFIRGKACKSTADCTVVPSICGKWDAVNAEHAKEMKEYYEEMASKIECKAPDGAAAPQAACVLGQCRPTAPR